MYILASTALFMVSSGWIGNTNNRERKKERIIEKKKVELERKYDNEHQG